MSLFYNSTFVVGISFFLFFAMLGYLGVHNMLGKLLDDRADKIRDELDEARKLREEAQAAFAEFERKHKEVEGIASEIVAHAKVEAEAAAERAKEELKVSIERRLRAADEQIAMAEAAALKEVKDKAVSVAIAAATQVISEKLDGNRTEAMIAASIDQVGNKLH